MAGRKRDVSREECRFCGRQGKLRAGKVPYQLAIGRVLFRTELPAVVCSACKEPLVTSAVLGKFEIVAARWLASSGLVDGPAFRFMRKAIGLKSQDLAGLLDVTPETVSRWEHAKLPIDGKAVKILGLLVEDAFEGSATTIERLRAMPPPARAKRSRRLVDLEVA